MTTDGLALLPSSLHGIALFSGVGRLERSLDLVLGTRYRTVCHVERDAYAAAVLVARMEDQAMDPSPIWDDVSTFDGRPWRGLVDFISGGFPCQDISNAGNRKGIRKGKRSGLWFQYARIIGEVEPRYVWVENVGALARRGLDIVLGSLADLGFDAEWLTLRASDVGASHGRKRLFILAIHRGRMDDAMRRRCGRSEEEVLPGRDAALAAGGSVGHADRARRAETIAGSQVDAGTEPGPGSRPLANPNGEGQRCSGESAQGMRGQVAEQGGDVASGNVPDGCDVSGGVAHPDHGPGGEEPRLESGELTSQPGRSCEELADPVGPGHEGNGPAESPRRSEFIPLRGDGPEIPLFAPGPGERELWGEILAHCPHLAPAIKPRFRFLFDGLGMVVDKSRTDQLRCGGNGVVDVQAAFALAVLARRLDLWEEFGIDQFLTDRP